MGKQVYFVVYADLDTKELIVDDGTLEARFNEGSIWNTETNEWEDEAKISELAEAQEILKKGLVD
jgi:hypothetical protein